MSLIITGHPRSGTTMLHLTSFVVLPMNAARPPFAPTKARRPASVMPSGRRGGGGGPLPGGTGAVASVRGPGRLLEVPMGL